jgi:LemA protein
VSIEDRIERMLESGTLTADQADSMRSSINQNPQPDNLTIHKRVPLAKIMAVLIGLGLLTILIAGGGDTEPLATESQNVAEMMNQTGGIGEMHKYLQNTLSLVVIFLPILLCVFFVMYLYNNMVSMEEEVVASWSQVESQIQRRADLIPNLVNTVKGYAKQEKEVLVEVTAQRAKLAEALASLKKSKDKAEELSGSAAKRLDDEAFMARLATAQNRFSKDVTGIFALVENYPELKSSDNFMALQDQIEGTENRINIARVVFNQTVRDFNKAIRVMPGSLVAKMSGFKRKAYFEVAEENKENVKVEF